MSISGVWSGSRNFQVASWLLIKFRVSFVASIIKCASQFSYFDIIDVGNNCFREWLWVPEEKQPHEEKRGGYRRNNRKIDSMCIIPLLRIDRCNIAVQIIIIIINFGLNAEYRWLCIQDDCRQIHLPVFLGTDGLEEALFLYDMQIFSSSSYRAHWLDTT